MAEKRLKTDEDNTRSLEPVAKAVRAGWADASGRIAKANDDKLIMGEFSNSEDSIMEW